MTHIFLLAREKKPPVLSKRWKRQAVAWAIFLCFGLASTSLSPFPSRSLLGHSITADGLLYWVLLSGFVLTNSLVLQIFPQLFRWQLRGILIGTALVAVSMLPQRLNWQIDYTMHSGQLWSGTKHVLATGIYKNHQPIGLYSHRGYAAFALSFASVFTLVSLQKKWIPIGVGIPLFVTYSGALSLANVRGATLSMIIGTLWLCSVGLRNKYVRGAVIAIALVGLLSIGWATAERKVANATHHSLSPVKVAIKHITSDRSYLWNMAQKDFRQRPNFGWGFGGYSIIDAIRLCPNQTELVKLGNYYAYCRDENRQIVRKPVGMTKAHNLVLDSLISLGLFGTAAYAYLLYVSVNSLQKTAFYIRAIFIVYIVYALTWYDCGQISHLLWWAVSLHSVSDRAQASLDCQAG